MSINDLIKAKSEQRLALSNQANKLIPEKRSMTPEENAQFDAIHADADKIGDEITRLQKQLKLENDMGTPRSNGIQIGNVRTSFDGDEMDQKKELKAWREYLDHGSVTGELRANVEYANSQKRDYTTGGTTGGGYLAPTISAVGFNEILVDYLDIRQAPLGKFETFGGNLTNYPNWNYNGSSAARTAEGATVGTDTSAVAGNTQFSAFNYDSQLIPLSIQFIQDNVLPIDQIINKEIGKRLGLSINWDFTNGSGSGVPQGITVGAGASGTTLSTTGLGSSTTVAYQNLVDIIYSIPSPYRNRKSTGWMMHPKTFAAVRKLVDSNGRPLYAIVA
jgi:HK97 family phage major capsid protein